MFGSILASMSLVLLTGCDNYNVTPTSRSLPPHAFWSNWHAKRASRPGEAQVCPTGSFVTHIRITRNAERPGQEPNTEIYIEEGVCSDGSRLKSGASFGSYGCLERHRIKSTLHDSDGWPDVTVSKNMRLRYLGFGGDQSGYARNGLTTLSCGSGKLIAGWQIQTGCAVDAIRVYCVPVPPPTPAPTPAAPSGWEMYATSSMCSGVSTSGRSGSGTACSLVANTLEKCLAFTKQSWLHGCRGDYMYFTDTFIGPHTYQSTRLAPCCCVRKGFDCKVTASPVEHNIYKKQGATPSPTPASDWVLHASSAYCEDSGRDTMCTDTNMTLDNCQMNMLTRESCGNYVMYNNAPNGLDKWQCCCVVKGKSCSVTASHPGRNVYVNQLAIP